MQGFHYTKDFTVLDNLVLLNIEQFFYSYVLFACHPAVIDASAYFFA